MAYKKGVNFCLNTEGLLLHHYFRNQLHCFQDDNVITLLLMTTKLYPISHSIPPNLCLAIQPHLLFNFFCKHIDYDHCVVVDWLISGETKLLEYLVV